MTSAPVKNFSLEEVIGGGFGPDGGAGAACTIGDERTGPRVWRPVPLGRDGADGAVVWCCTPPTLIVGKAVNCALTS